MESIKPIVGDGNGIGGYNFHEVTLAKDQHNPLQAAVIHKMTVPVLSRWRLSVEELELIMNGGEICLFVITGGNPFPPINLQVVAQDKNPEVPVV